MASKNEQALAAEIDELKRRLAAVETAPVPELQLARKRAEQDRIWWASKAVADITDPAERASALLAADHEVKREFWQRMCDHAAEALATARALPAAHRAGLVAMAPPSLQAEMTVLALPAPARVRLYLREDVSSWSSSAIPGERPHDRYPGLRLTSRTKPTTEAGATERVFLESVFNRMCEIDGELCDAIRRGVVIVEDVSPDESRAMLANEIAQLSPHERPRIAW